MQDRWQIWVDRGGTFTDLVGRDPAGTFHTRKLLSEAPHRRHDAVVQGIADLLDLAADDPGLADRLAEVKLGTTVTTNALLEHKGEPTVLLITDGLNDALQIGDQTRPDIFALHVVRPHMLYERVIGVPERMAADGNAVVPLDPAPVEAALRQAFTDGYRSVAIVLMHADRYPDHERQVRDLARRLGFPWVTASHERVPIPRLIPRGDTTVLDAYLSPVLRRYVDRLMAALPGTPMRFMQSHGGLTTGEHFFGKDSLVSGPAGGVVGAARTSARAGFNRIIGFDMGGTSTDVTRCDGHLDRIYDTTLAGVRIRTPMLAIHTVAAGGGSIIRFDGQRLRVGPESAGALPGPAAYGNGGPLTVTDANLQLGRLQPAYFPAVFGTAGDAPLDSAIVAARFTALAETINQGQAGTNSPEAVSKLPEAATMTPEAVAAGALTIAVAQMAAAIRRISLEQGYDVTTYALCAFGAAAGQHACQVAETLGITTVVLHPFAGVLSAFGMGLADQRQLAEQGMEKPLDDEALQVVQMTGRALADDGRNTLIAQDVPADRIRSEQRLRLRYAGTDHALAIEGAGDEAGPWREAFETAHRQLYGFTLPGQAVTIESLVVETIGEHPLPDLPVLPPASGALSADTTVRLYAADRWQDAPVYRREALRPGHTVSGPALIVSATDTAVVEPGWLAVVRPTHHLVLTQDPAGRVPTVDRGTAADPVRLTIFNQRFRAIAEQMGVTLQQTSHSVNIKERLDFSCALFNAAGDLIANAPHIPVHLGSMGDSVRAILDLGPDALQPGDAWVINNPYAGGTHLPDITVVSPVFDRMGLLRFVVASRGHHADVGGITPGSMPPHSHTIADEGILFDRFRVMRDGQFDESGLRAKLAEGPWPARKPDQNVADLAAQIAANTQGASELLRLADDVGMATVEAYMGHVLDAGEQAVRQAIRRLTGERTQAGESLETSRAVPMDDGSVIAVRIALDPVSGGAEIDFTGTSPQRPSNLNAPVAVCRAVVLYVFRTLVADDIPLNAGCLRPLTLTIPAGSMVNPAPPAAVVAGNVETSQVIADALYGALGVLAASQGTMNNVTFGTGQYQYYETLCGGTGAGPDFDGADAVHSHMTNSRLTDPEILETRYPVRVETFRIRKGSGGAGRQRGGDGAIRRLRLLAPMTVSVLTNNRRVAPFGLAGGGDGLCGVNRLERADGTVESLGSSATVDTAVGDALDIETPGGGGFGVAIDPPGRDRA
jgi:5-oxoprolinase (ATP-hydrolysing)